MASRRPYPLSICIEGKACAPAGSNVCHNEFVLLTFMSSIDVGDASRCYSGCDQTNGYDDPLDRRCFGHSMNGGLGLSKTPSITGSVAVLPPECRFCQHGTAGRRKNESTIDRSRDGLATPNQNER